jgi:hypothetical protein
MRQPENWVKYPSFITRAKGFCHGSNLFYQLTLIVLLWLCLLFEYAWPSDRAVTRPTPPQRKRRRDLKSFEGLTTKPHCDACAHVTASHPQAPSSSATAPRAHAGVPTPGRHLNMVLQWLVEAAD